MEGHLMTRPTSTVRTARAFAVHYVQMLLAMGAGMVLLLPAWALATQGLAAAWSARPEVPPLVMATSMAAGMSAWMRLRRHSCRDAVEMSASMYAGFVALFPFLWLGLLDGDGVMALGHVLMLVTMAVAMLARSEVYAVPHLHRRPTS